MRSVISRVHARARACARIRVKTQTPIQNACYAATCYEVYAHQQDNVAIRKINEWIWTRDVK